MPMPSWEQSDLPEVPLNATLAAVQALYDADSDREWERVSRHRTEFAVSWRVLCQVLPPPPARILDCGGGPGRYAIELARLGYDVTLFDLSAANLARAEREAAAAGVALSLAQGDAADLSRYADDQFDATLLMGPLYHLLDGGARSRALQEAKRVSRAGAPIFVAFITRYAAHRWAAAYAPHLIVDHRERLERILTTGQQPPDSAGDTTFVAYFTHPDEVATLVRRAELEVEAVFAVEGIVSRIEETVNALEGEAWTRWVDFNHRVAVDPTLHSGADHLLVVARKPRWRPVLWWLARQLLAAGLPFKVVGSAALALHGVALNVRDLDVETEVAAAYRIGDLLAPYAVEPVALRESSAYRSHIGRFRVDGVEIEVMGGIERPGGAGWIPTPACTETIVDLAGVPVPVSWLEEEALAYIRRGRLQRTALCLPHCDQDRLLSLLRGEVKTTVL